jgi:hypothetical protein
LYNLAQHGLHYASIIWYWSREHLFRNAILRFAFRPCQLVLVRHTKPRFVSRARSNNQACPRISRPLPRPRPRRPHRQHGRRTRLRNLRARGATLEPRSLPGRSPRQTLLRPPNLRRRACLSRLRLIVLVYRLRQCIMHHLPSYCRGPRNASIVRWKSRRS